MSTISLSSRRIRAVVGKELREYRRNRALVVTMGVIPVLFCIQPLVSVLALQASASTSLSHEHALLYLLGLPALVPTLLAASSIVGERQQGTLEPVLTTPIRREELLLGKALAALVPSIAVAYVVYALFLALTALFGQPGVASALIRGPDLLAQILFTPLIAGWTIWLAIAISTRCGDIRVAQQLAVLAALPSVVVTTLIALNVIPPTPVVAIAALVALLLLDGLGWRVTSAMFDRERLITGTR